MDDEDLIPISALQHYLYCPRQCALIHMERLWAESRHTAEGRLLHENADKPAAERRKGVRLVTAMPLFHPELGLTGMADVVEFHQQENAEQAVPVEYKRGRPKAHRADEVQLCAQALCLEAMLGSSIAYGFLFYGKTRRRKEIAFDSELRELTRQTVYSVRNMMVSGKTPLAGYDPRRCDACSLIELCRPRWLAHSRTVSSWLQQQLED
ncbi:MAG: CRISPR-associated protein Cas4 [Acidobacteriaceae bacterium]|nr:CRISPR-associated protein Cas4 [Acidobacteriaceae bacterium]